MTAVERSLVAIPCPGVVIAKGFAARLERCLASRARARGARELAGNAAADGAGHDVVGHRTYRAGDDVRGIDWSASARGEDLVVRMTRREAGARWRVLVDASRSMGVGPPGKLQLAAEIALGLAASGLAQGARVELVALLRGAPGASACDVARRAHLEQATRWAESLRADGVLERERLARDARGALERCVLVTDACGLDPASLALLARPGRALDVVLLLAPHEIAPSAFGPVAWRDAESPARIATDVDARAIAAYARALDAHLDAWRAAARAARARVCIAPSSQPFESVLAALA